MGEDGKRNVREKVYVCERSARVLNEGMDGEKQWHGIRRKRMYGDAYILYVGVYVRTCRDVFMQDK